MGNRCGVAAGFVMRLAFLGWAGGAAPPKWAVASNQCENQSPRALDLGLPLSTCPGRRTNSIAKQ